ncbi:MAG: type II toxin-antitoxin system VapC family toxin [Paludibacteraceae bacterium]|nr:type II toxin-antitoxin system VapC family toxin [Paludibacteraceae bacterium]
MTDRDLLSHDVRAIFEDYNNQFFMSAESIKELIVGYNNKRLCSKKWKTALEMIEAIKQSGLITILPITEQHLETYSRMQLNEMQGHKDPSDHIIIAQAITEKLPLISSDTRFPFYRNQGLELIFNTK